MTLEDALFVERGNLVSRGDVPAKTGNRIRARVFWLHSSALEAGARIGVSVGTADAKGAVTAIHHAIDPGRLAPTESQSIGRNHVGEIEITLDRPIACDPYEANPATGRVVLECDGRIAGGGLVLEISTGAAAVAAPAVQSGRSAPLAELQTQAARLTAALVGLSPVQRIARLRQEIPGKVTFTTSFGTEDQAILHWISSLQADIDVVTLDTGRLFPETYDLWAETERRYGRKSAQSTRGTTSSKNSSRSKASTDSTSSRMPASHAVMSARLNRSTGPWLGANAWITGLRGNQSTYRAGMEI